ncbi:hypothetical protein PRZ48_008141 [Zasmidium cellare]|uniref:Enoyl reductase (ER) domain-containing protein n=1 Tax=Zasmidium cellare TaxID=395010 RepID=A0ABR0EEN5_ZASCE|nr:hypothetical protein PRZ48_008141 [Zasmidium cellare]
MRALIWAGTRAEVVTDRPKPRLRDNYLLIKTAAVALNPTDAKAISQGRAATNGLLGCDFAGTVIDIGQAVTKSWEPGDRVFGCVHGANFNNGEDGAFAEYIVAKGDTCMRMPDHTSFEEACTLGVSVLTCGQGLFQEMKLGFPPVSGEMVKTNESILIYGGSSSSGMVAIQICSLYVSCTPSHIPKVLTSSRAGYTVLTTCTPAIAALCKSLGAEAIFDYHDTDCGNQISGHTNGQLKLAWDTIGSPSSTEICMQALTQEPGAKYGTILFNDILRRDVQYSSSFLMTFLGESFDKFGKHMPGQVEHFEFAKKFTGLVDGLLERKRLRPLPVRLCSGGFEGVLDGVKLITEGRVSGCKLVVRVDGTA